MTDNPHDALFQYVFSNVEHAAPALRTMLPAALSLKVDFSTLSLAPGHFVDPQLDGHRSDLLFSARIGGRPGLIYVLFEHQSYVDRWLLLRLLEYMVRIWRAYRDEHPRAKRLPPIVPVVLHHSNTGWRAARRFEEIVDVAPDLPEMLEHVPRFGFVLDDVSRMDDGELSQRAMTSLGQIMLLLFRHARSPDELFAALPRLTLAFLEVANAQDGGAAIAAVMEYLRSVSKREEREVVMAVRAAIGESVYDRIFYAGERLERRAEERGLQRGLERGLEQGLERGLERGLEQGVLQGRRMLLARQLKLRFGELPASAKEALDAASIEDLDAMAERILTARTLAEVLGPVARPARKSSPRRKR